jgi:hypothetical protein
MPNVPDAIDRAQLMAALADLGIDTTNLRSLTADVYTVRLTYYAVNAEGKKYLTDGAPTEYTHEVKILNTGGLISAGQSDSDSTHRSIRSR